MSAILVCGVELVKQGNWREDGLEGIGRDVPLTISNGLYIVSMETNVWRGSVDERDVVFRFLE